MDTSTQLGILMPHAVAQFGKDRVYHVRFGGSTPVIAVYEDEFEIAQLWMVNAEIHQKIY